MKSKNIIESFKFAFKGLVDGVRERNLKIHYITMILVIIVGLFFKISSTEWYVLLILFGIVISLEYVNTAIETVVDLVCPTKNPLARLAKDLAASAVLVSAIISFIIGIMIFLPKITDFIR